MRTVAPRFLELRQKVRAYRPSDLLAAVGVVAAAISDPGPGFVKSWRRTSPWGLAIIAREAVLYGTEFRAARSVAGGDVVTLHDRLNDCYDPEPDGTKDFALGVLARTAYEQFPYQESDGEEVARTWAVLHVARALVNPPTLTAAAVEELLGGPLVEVLAAGLNVYGSLRSSGGAWDEAFWTGEESAETFGEAATQETRRLAASLTATIPVLREAARRAPAVPPHLIRYSFNPLVGHPLVELPDGRTIAPQPRLVLRRLSPGGLYYPGVARFGKAFADDLGPVVERYVGLTLEAVQGTAALPEILYGKPERRSIDWFWIFDDVLVLVEVKALRAVQDSRVGAPDFAQTLGRRLQDARDQIDRTQARLEDNTVGFTSVPHRLQVVGLVITAEPIYQGNASLLRPYLAGSSVPISILSLRDLERLVTYPADVIAAALVAVADDPDLSSWNLISAVTKATGTGPAGRPPLLEAAFDAIAPQAADPATSSVE